MWTPPVVQYASGFQGFLDYLVGDWFVRVVVVVFVIAVLVLFAPRTVVSILEACVGEVSSKRRQRTVWIDGAGKRAKRDEAALCEKYPHAMAMMGFRKRSRG